MRKAKQQYVLSDRQYYFNKVNMRRQKLLLCRNLNAKAIMLTTVFSVKLNAKLNILPEVPRENRLYQPIYSALLRQKKKKRTIVRCNMEVGLYGTSLYAFPG